jgi:osmoprotectant transport system ATP-binding protein
VFVTHDIDVAVRLGNRIAVLGPAGVLQQYADPSTLLAAPANDSVAAFVGADRGIRRMSVTPLTQEDLSPVSELPAGRIAGDGRAAEGAPSIRLGASLREGFAALAGIDEAALPVVDDTGRAVGALTPDGVHAALRRSAAAAAERAAAEGQGASQP